MVNILGKYSTEHNQDPDTDTVKVHISKTTRVAQSLLCIAISTFLHPYPYLTFSKH